MSLVYIDVETTGLDPTVHQVWEIAYAVDDGPIQCRVVPHSTVSADLTALEVGQYGTRSQVSATAQNARWFEDDAYCALDGNTLVGANPAFDAAFLRARWGEAPWKHRLLDVETYAMGALGHDEPQGLSTITRELRARGYDIPEPDHTAAGDVACVRACHLAVRDIYATTGQQGTEQHGEVF